MCRCGREVVKVGPTQLGKPTGAWLVATITADGDACCALDRTFETREAAEGVARAEEYASRNPPRVTYVDDKPMRAGRRVPEVRAHERF